VKKKKKKLNHHRAPEKGGSVMWSSLLQSYRVHGNEIVGRRVAKTLMELELENLAICLQVSNFWIFSHIILSVFHFFSSFSFKMSKAVSRGSYLILPNTLGGCGQ
jgi:beta-lactamase class D